MVEGRAKPGQNRKEEQCNQHKNNYTSRKIVKISKQNKRKKEKKQKQNHNLLNKQTQTAPKPRSSTSPPFFNPSERQGATTIYGGVTKKTLTSFQGQLSSCLNGGLVIRLLAKK